MDGVKTSGAEDTEEDLQAKATQMRVRYVDLSTLELDPEVGQLISEEMARRYKLVCIGKLEKRVTLAMVDPLDVFAIDDIRLRTGFEVDAVLSRASDIKKAMDRLYGDDHAWKKLVDQASDEKGLHVHQEAEEEEDVEAQIDQPVIKLTNMIIVSAIEKKASDIHIEPFENEVIVRYRCDGMLHEEMSDIPISLLPAVVARIKIMAQLRIDEKRVPQDGRIQLSVSGKDLDLRVSTLPVVHGESVVMRILDRSNTRVDLTQLGFDKSDLALWTDLFSKPNGIVLVTGPTGSGKSTTLYATLNVLNQPNVKLLTVEDPVEYNIKGINQVQVNNKAGLTFAKALKAFLRQDPDIIMLGEIRDEETGTIAVEAALTGHLVLSTLHTNSAIASIIRLSDMGIEPFLVASTLNGILAQRLVRKVCPACAEPIPVNEKLREIFTQWNLDADDAQLMKGRGCQQCSELGYKGRLGIYELFKTTDNLRDMIVKGSSQLEMEAEAKASGGLNPLYFDGLRKVHQGFTTYEEILRVTSA